MPTQISFLSGLYGGVILLRFLFRLIWLVFENKNKHNTRHKKRKENKVSVKEYPTVGLPDQRFNHRMELVNTSEVK